MFAANQVHQVGGVAAVQHTESFGQAKGSVVTAKRGVGDRMKGPAGDPASLVGRLEVLEHDSRSRAPSDA